MNRCDLEPDHPVTDLRVTISFAKVRIDFIVVIEWKILVRVGRTGKPDAEITAVEKPLIHLAAHEVGSAFKAFAESILCIALEKTAANNGNNSKASLQ